MPCGVGADLHDGLYLWPHMASWFAFNCHVSAEEFNISEIYDEAGGQYVPVDSPAERLWTAFEGLVMGGGAGRSTCVIRPSQLP